MGTDLQTETILRHQPNTLIFGGFPLKQRRWIAITRSVAIMSGYLLIQILSKVVWVSRNSLEQTSESHESPQVLGTTPTGPTRALRFSSKGEKSGVALWGWTSCWQAGSSLIYWSIWFIKIGFQTSCVPAVPCAAAQPRAHRFGGNIVENSSFLIKTHTISSHHLVLLIILLPHPIKSFPCRPGVWQKIFLTAFWTCT